MACSSTCPTQDHATYGECLRSKGISVYGLESTGNDFTKQKAWDKELDSYEAAKRQGIQPASTSTSDIREAVELSNAVGRAYRADTNSFN